MRTRKVSEGERRVRRSKTRTGVYSEHVVAEKDEVRYPSLSATVVKFPTVKAQRRYYA